MSTINDGGPAFPLGDSCCEYGNTNRSAANGMTLRDYFAAAAIQGFCSNPNGHANPNHVADWLTKHGAVSAYRIADKMLEARSKHDK